MATARAETTTPQIARISRPALIIGAVALVIGIAGAFLSGIGQFFQSYLYAFVFWLVLSMGGLGLLILQYLTGGRWGQTIKRILEAMALTLPLMGILFLPILGSVIAGNSPLYAWNQPAQVAGNHILELRAPYMNATWFTIRAVLYFAIWIGLTYGFVTLSRRQDRTGDPKVAGRLGRLAGLAIVLFVLSYSFAMIEWAMTTEKVWYSTMYPVLFIVSSALTGLAFSSVVLSYIRGFAPLSKIANANRFHDLGSLTFAFTVLWTYVNFSQFLIMFSANIAEEAEFYVHRSANGWQYLAQFIILCCFALPFFTLLSRRTKRSPQRMRVLGIFILFTQLINLFWVIVPGFHPEQLQVSWLDLVSLVAVGGLWLGTFTFWLGSRPLVTENDPRQAASLERHPGDTFEGERTPAHA